MAPAEHDHSHTSVRSSRRHRGRLLIAFVILATFMVVEVVAGFISRSLALISDAGHMLTDVIGLAMTLAAISLAGRARANEDRTFGLYRLEILAVIANVLLLFGVAIYVLIEAINRFGEPVVVLTTPMLVVATLGLIANLVVFAVLRSAASESLNVEGAYLEVIADTVGSVGVIVAAALVATTGWTWVDPVTGIAIGVFILPRSWRLGAKAIRILVQSAPPHIDTAAVRSDLAHIEGVLDVHDLHIWTLTSDMDVISAHLVIGGSDDLHHVLDEARELLRVRHGISHATLQVEPADHHGCAEIDW